MTKQLKLSRREREVMDIIHALGEATASQIREKMADPPTNPAVRSILRILVKRDHLQYRQDGPRYVYYPTATGTQARRSALNHLLDTFFGGSVEGAMVALLDMDESQLSDDEKARMKALIDQARQQGR